MLSESWFHPPSSIPFAPVDPPTRKASSPTADIGVRQFGQTPVERFSGGAGSEGAPRRAPHVGQTPEEGSGTSSPHIGHACTEAIRLAATKPYPARTLPRFRGFRAETKLIWACELARDVAAPASSVTCAHCGAVSRLGTLRCPYCGLDLPLPPSPPVAAPVLFPRPDPYRLVPSTPASAPTSALVIVGIVLAVLGVFVLIGAAVVHQGVVSYNQGCSQIPDGSAAADPSGGIAAGGAILIILAVILVALGLSKSP